MSLRRIQGKLALSRRTMLRGMAGGAAVALGLPTLEAMLGSDGTALADGTPVPRRFLLYFFGNGVQPARWVPAAEGASYALSEELAPLANVKDYCSVLSGFYNAAGDYGHPHHGGVTGLLSGRKYIDIPASGAYATKYAGPTVDQIAAGMVGAETYLPSLEVAVSKRAIMTEGPAMQFLSHKGPDEPAPAETNPQEVYKKLFSNFSPPGDPEAKLRVSMLDAVMADAKRLQKRVGKADRERLDAHLESVALLEKQIMAVPPVCNDPGQPAEKNVDMVQGVEPLLSVSNVMADLVALAFACDLTRVVSFAQTLPQAVTVFTSTGATEHEHALSHDANGQELVHAAVVFNMQCFAYLLERFKATEDGAGHLLDNAVVLLGSDCSLGFTHDVRDMPLIVAGRGGGSLVYPGVHYRSPDASAPESTSDVVLACLKTVAPEATEFGDDVGYSATPCPAIYVG